MPSRAREQSHAEALVVAWSALVGPLAGASAGASVEAAGRTLVDRYAESHRSYHDLRHLREVIERLGAIASPLPPDPRTVLAAWFHDAVYDPRAADNEDASARVAADVLSGLRVDPGVVADVASLVRATAAHDVAELPPGLHEAAAALFDADLAILAASAERYSEYAAAVRAEYAHVDEDAFRAGRLAVLERLAGRPWLFMTAYGRREWEQRARANLSGELRRLSGGGSAAGRRS